MPNRPDCELDSSAKIEPSHWNSRPRRTRLAWPALLLASLMGILQAASSGCLDRPIGAPTPVTTNVFVDRISQDTIDKIDLLFMIDNSISMSDKQAILRLAVPDLINRLVNPVCVDANGAQYAPPADPAARCPPNPTGLATSREFNPINDINIAIVSSSLGDAGASVGSNPLGPCGGGETVDMGHLMGSLARGRGIADNSLGFLEWRPGVDVERFIADSQRLVSAVGEYGCGYEHQLESWYRFLIDPYPYQELVRVRCRPTDAATNCVQPATDAEGRIVLDQTLLDQRNAFLRDDSLVAIVMLTDENDCSVQVGGQSWVALGIRDGRPMFSGSSACAANPNDACCYSCPLGPPDGCAPDPLCNETEEHAANRLPPGRDGYNLRCLEQKRRFGIDFLYPTQRYVNALQRFDLCWSSPTLDPDTCEGEIAPNPLYAGGRTPSLVFLAGIIGVPWQLIAADTDVLGGPLAADALRFKTAAELTTDDDWSAILGSSGAAASADRPGTPPVPPRDPHMWESATPRSGLRSPDPISGREFDTTQGSQSGAPDDLQYACVFPLPASLHRDCAAVNAASGDACDCFEGQFDRPLCEQTPGSGRPGTIQYHAKAYPGLRELQVLKDYGENSIVASICARNVDDDARPDFGYRPAIGAIIDRLKEKLGDRCLPRRLALDQDGTVPCTIVETRLDADVCECDPRIARANPEANVAEEVRLQLRSERGNPCGADGRECARACSCEVLPVQRVQGQGPDALLRCQEDAEAQGIEGWCYVADTADQQIGSPELVAECPATSRRLLRFVGQGLLPDTLTFVSCIGSTFASQAP